MFVKMTGWYYDKRELKNTPSSQDNIDYDTEIRYRKEGARFIIETGMKMDLGYNTTATGVVYFHRFYMFHSFRQFPRYVTACCCLFLAGKVEETPKKCKDIIKIARSQLSDQKFATFGEDPKEEVMTLEKILLQTIKFDLQVEHPYGYLLEYAKCLKGDKTKKQKMVQMAWTFINDSLCTTLSLQWEPEIIAVALMYLAGKLSQFEVIDWTGRSPRHLRWWDMFVEDITMDLLEDICHQVLDLYSPSNTTVTPTPESPPLPASKQSQNQNSLPNRKSANGQDRFEDVQEPPPIIDTKLPPPSSDIPAYPYQTFTSAPPPGFPATYSGAMSAPPHMTGPPPGPPPHITAPPPTVFPPPFVSHPPPFTAVVPPTGHFFQAAALSGQPHRPYYPPPQ